VPQIRPFRALRYEPSAIDDLGDVIAPVATKFDAAERDRVPRHPADIASVDLPADRSGDEADDRYRRAARALAEWRSSAILHKDPHPSIYVYEVTPPDHDVPCQLGYFGRLRLEPLGDGTIEAGERATPEDVEDRYRLMRATGINSRPVIGLYDDPTGGSRARLATITARPPDVDVRDVAGTRHRLWAMPADGTAEAAVQALVAPAIAGPISIVAGRAVYDSAVRYRDERRMSRSCEEDPPFDYVLALLIERSDAIDPPMAAIGLVLNPHEW
jgi:uncharacterized protein (DUF1015 family)